VAVDVLLDN